MRRNYKSHRDWNAALSLFMLLIEFFFMVLKIKKEINKKGISSLQVNGVDLAEIAGGQVAITNMHSCNVCFAT